MYTLDKKNPSSVPRNTVTLKKAVDQTAPQTKSQEEISEKISSKSGRKTLLSWQALQFESTPKSSAWYIVVFIILVSLVAVGLFTDNFPLAILAILIGLILYLFEKKDAQYFKFGVTEEGVFAQDRIYKFSSLETFWIFYEPNGRKDLSLKSKKSFIPYVHIPLGDMDPTALRETLVDFLPEEEHEEAVVDSLEKLM